MIYSSNSYRKSQTTADGRKIDTVAILVHDTIVAGPISASNPSLAKGLASERARMVLEDPKSDLSLAKLCDCAKRMLLEPTSMVTATDVDANIKNKAEVLLTDETEEGFAKLAERARKDFQDVATLSNKLVDDFADELAVETMLSLFDED